MTAYQSARDYLMKNYSAFIFFFSLLTTTLFAEETIQTTPSTVPSSHYQQLFLFGEMDAFQMATAHHYHDLISNFGLLYRTQQKTFGYDVAFKPIAASNGGQLTATYNFYLSKKMIQPYIATGAGLILDNRDSNPFLIGTIPVLFGVNSKIFFSDIGITAYLVTREVALIMPQARIGLGFQF